MVLYNESDKIVEVCELTTVKRPNQASIQSPFLKVSKPEMNNSELMKDEMLRQYTPSIRTISWFIFPGQFCLDTGIMNVLHLSPVRRNQNLARFKPVHISLTLLEHPSIRLRANVPEFPFDRGKDVNVLDWATLFQGYPTVKSPIVTSFTAVTPRLLLHLKTYLMTGSIEISSSMVRLHNDRRTDDQCRSYPCSRTDPTVWKNRRSYLYLSCFCPLKANLRQNIALRRINVRSLQQRKSTVEVHRLSSD